MRMTPASLWLFAVGRRHFDPEASVKIHSHSNLFALFSYFRFCRELLVASTVVAATACGNTVGAPTAPNLTGASHAETPLTGNATAAGMTTVTDTKVDICHRTEGVDGFILIGVAQPAVAAHLLHGDGRMGDPVPGQRGMVFGPDCAPTAAQLPPVLDQTFEAPPFMRFGFGGDGELSQTFTVGITGILTQVAVQIRRDAGIQDIVLEIRTTAGGIPVASTGGTLASVVIPNACVPTDVAFVAVDVSAAQIPVAAGDVLAIALRAPGQGGSLSYSWQGSVTNAYAPGADFFRNGVQPSWTPLFGDLGFRTFVAPSMP